MNIKKRLLLGAGVLGTVGAVATLAAGVTFGLFSATTGPTTASTFAAGTVSLTSDATGHCTVSKMVPGDATAGWVAENTTGAVNTDNTASEVACTLAVTYTGSAKAYLGVDLAITGTGNGGNGLYDSTPTGLQFYIHDTSGATYANGDPFVAVGGSASASNLLVSTTPFATGGIDTITVDYFLPNGAGNSYQSATSSLTMTVHAVQSSHNPEGGTVSLQGAPTTDISWG